MRKYIIIIGVALIFFLSSDFLFSADLQWTKSEDVTGYRICWKTASDQDYIDCIDEIDPGATSFSLIDSPFDDTYYYAIQAYNAFGSISGFSGEVEVNGIPKDLARNLKIQINNENDLDGVVFELTVNYNDKDTISYPLLNGIYDLVNTHFLVETDIQVTAKQGDKILEIQNDEGVDLSDFRMNNDMSIVLDCDSMGIVVSETSPEDGGASDSEDGNTGGSNDNISNDSNINTNSLADDNSGRGSCFISSLLE